MKLSLHINKNENSSGWTIKYSHDSSIENKTFAPRELGRIGEDGQGFPVPPIGESANWENKGHKSLCETTDSGVIQRLLRRVFYATPQAEDIKNLGNYLSAVLFGTYWADFCVLAEPNEKIALELFIAPDDFEIQRLPWEMMYEADVPLAALEDRDVPITRMIKGGDAPQTVTLNLPLKVLFVIGRKIDNALRPGAEYLGLLHRMKIKFDEGERNRYLNIKVLTEATWDELKEAVEEFQPRVVHFISHGDESGQLLLSKRDEQTSELLDDPDYCDAAKLLHALRADKPPHDVPPIVVLNACHTAEVDFSTSESYRSMAAHLVAGGAAVAVGMTGEVADGACRLFTRRFYQALISENCSIDISVSTARGRRAAMLFYVSKDITFYENHIEWARPTLFLKDNVTFKLETDEVACLRAEAPQQFIIDGTTFCDRLSYLKHYQKFIANSQSTQHGKMLLFNTNAPIDPNDRYGKTRLLRELAALTLVNGFIPCPVFSGTNFEPPPNLLLFALTLADAMDFTRVKLKLNAKKYSHALKLIAYVFGRQLPSDIQGFEFDLEKENLQKNTRQLGAPGQPSAPTAAIIRSAILKDLKELRNDLAEFEFTAPIIVFIDDFHRYDGVTNEFLNDVFFNEYGLGDMEMPVSVIATYSTHGEQSNAQKDIINFIKDVNSRIYARKAIELKQIEDVEEARLACMQHLLNLEKPLAVNTRKDIQQYVETLIKNLLREIRGVPSLFNSSTVKALLQLGEDSGFLLTANDEMIYDSLNK